MLDIGLIQFDPRTLRHTNTFFVENYSLNLPPWTVDSMQKKSKRDHKKPAQVEQRQKVIRVNLVPNFGSVSLGNIIWHFQTEIIM